MSFEQPPKEGQGIELLPEIPKEVKSYWELLTHMGEKDTTPNDHVDKLTEITKNLSEKEPEFQEIFEKHKNDGVVGMMDALEEYSRKLTEPDYKDPEHNID